MSNLADLPTRSARNSLDAEAEPVGATIRRLTSLLLPAETKLTKSDPAPDRRGLATGLLEQFAQVASRIASLLIFYPEATAFVRAGVAGAQRQALYAGNVRLGFCDGLDAEVGGARPVGRHTGGASGQSDQQNYSGSGRHGPSADEVFDHEISLRCCGLPTRPAAINPR